MLDRTKNERRGGGEGGEGGGGGEGGEYRMQALHKLEARGGGRAVNESKDSLTNIVLELFRNIHAEVSA